MQTCKMSCKAALPYSTLLAVRAYSHGCHNHCWFCSVPKLEGSLRELPISDGWILLDDIFSLVPKITLEPSLTCLNAKNKGQSSGAALRLNYSNLGTSTCSSRLSLNKFSSLTILLMTCLLLNTPLTYSRRQATATGTFFAVTSLLVIPVILSTLPLSD